VTDAGQVPFGGEFAPEAIARSRDMGAAAAGELKEYERWLKGFVAAEERKRRRYHRALERRAQMLRREEESRRRSRERERAALKLRRASATGLSTLAAWLAPRSQALLLQARQAASTGVTRTVSTTRVIARNSSRLTAAEVSLAYARGRALAKQAQDVAARGAAQTGDAARIAFGLSLAVLAQSGSWVCHQTAAVLRLLKHGRALAMPRLQTATAAGQARLNLLSTEVRLLVERRSEDAAFLAMRLNAQLKGEMDALRRALQEKRLALPRWHHAARLAFAEHAASALGDSNRSSRNALIPREPWRCRLPMIRPGDSLVSS
jgi:hypothetical protein